MLRVGTSGWSYDHWTDVLDAAWTPSRERLARYVGAFDTVEMNASFDRWPPTSTFDGWRRRLLVAVDNPRLRSLLVISIIVVIGLLSIWRPLLFASVDPVVAAARGVPTPVLSVVFMVLLGLATAVSVQIVGSILVLSVLVTPAIAARRVTSSPTLMPVLSVLFAVVSMVGGIMLALGGSIPISPFVTTISFAVYLGCRLVGRRRSV